MSSALTDKQLIEREFKGKSKTVITGLLTERKVKTGVGNLEQLAERLGLSKVPGENKQALVDRIANAIRPEPVAAPQGPGGAAGRQTAAAGRPNYTYEDIQGITNASGLRVLAGNIGVEGVEYIVDINELKGAIVAKLGLVPARAQPRPEGKTSAGSGNSASSSNTAQQKVLAPSKIIPPRAEGKSEADVGMGMKSTSGQLTGELPWLRDLTAKPVEEENPVTPDITYGAAGPPPQISLATGATYIPEDSRLDEDVIASQHRIFAALIALDVQIFPSSDANPETDNSYTQKLRRQPERPEGFPSDTGDVVELLQGLIIAARNILSRQTNEWLDAYNGEITQQIFREIFGPHAEEKYTSTLLSPLEQAVLGIVIFTWFRLKTNYPETSFINAFLALLLIGDYGDYGNYGQVYGLSQRIAGALPSSPFTTHFIPLPVAPPTFDDTLGIDIRSMHIADQFIGRLSVLLSTEDITPALDALREGLGGNMQGGRRRRQTRHRGNRSLRQKGRRHRTTRRSGIKLRRTRKRHPLKI